MFAPTDEKKPLSFLGSKRSPIWPNFCQSKKEDCSFVDEGETHICDSLLFAVEKTVV
jgi:hypothetical protein